MKRLFIILLLTFCICFTFSAAKAETFNVVSDLYTTENGLSSTKITSITQDKDGFIWIGTEDGLNKFDGYQFIVYKRIPNDSQTLISDHITALYTDSNSRLWVATIDGLQYYDPEMDGFVRASLNQPDYIVKSNQCTEIKEDNQGNLWFACTGLGALRYNPHTDESHLFSPSHTQPDKTLCSGYIRSIAEDNNGNMYFGSQENGLSVYSPEKNQFTNYNSSNSGLLSNSIFGLALMDDGNILISTIGGGILVFDTEKREIRGNMSLFNSLPKRYIYYSLQDSQGQLLVGTEGNGLMIYDPQEQTLNPHPVFQERLQEIGDSKVHIIFEDRHGSIWVGMNYQGLCVIRPERQGFRTYKKVSNQSNSLSFGHVMGITVDRNKEVWIATDGGGLNRYNPQTKKYIHYKYREGDPTSISDNAVVSVYCDSKNRIWAGTYVGGLCLLDKEKGTFKRYMASDKPNGLKSNYIRSILEDDKGNLWLGTSGGGLSKFNPVTEEFKTFRENEQRGFANDYIIRLFIDSKNKLWIGSFFGLSCMDMDTETFIAYNNNSGLSNLSVYSINEDENGTLWVGTQSGLNRFNPERDKFEPITPNALNFSSVINGVIPHDNQLWISTNNGIVNFIPSTNTTKIYSAHNGLQSNEFILSSYYKSADGELYFGGINGFTAFNPSDIVNTYYSPQVYFTSLGIFNQTVQVNKELNGRVILPKSISHSDRIKLRHSDQSFTIEFTAPGTPEPSALVYACRMEGFDRDWIIYDNSRRYATYTNLNPGTYIFRVKASNDPNVWGSTDTSLIIEIAPPVWTTWWAKLIYFIIAIILAALITHFIIVRIRDRNELKIERMRLKQQEEMAQEKMQFFTNISHEFRTPLTLIISPLEGMIETEKDQERKQTEELMLRNAERLMRLINQILELRRLERGKMKPKAQEIELIPFISDVLGAFTLMADRKDISLTFTWEKEDIHIWFDSDMLDICIYNILSNAFKYTLDGGKVNVDISRDENDFTFIRISDTGVGMDEKDTEHVFDRFYQVENKVFGTGTGIGMHLTKSIIDLNGGDITVESEKGVGTTFCISIRPGNEYYQPDEISLIPYQRTAKNNSPTGISREGIPQYISEETPEKVSAGSDNSGNLTVLIVEDDEDMRRYVREDLKSTYTIIEANNGKNGIIKAQKYMPDLIISDVMMPEMSGTELCRELKLNPETSHIPIILLTAQGDIQQRIEGLETGADSYISKPFNMQHLKVRIEKLIELRQRLKERFSKSLNMEAHEVTITGADERLLQSVIDYIRENIEDSDLSVEAMSRDLGLSRTHLHRKLKALTGQSPVSFIKTIRMKQAAYLLRTGKLTIAEVGYKVGYSTPSYFSSSFNAHFGMSPTVYIENDGNSDEVATIDSQ